MGIRGLVEAAQAQARRILEANRTLLQEGARLLLERETLADQELAEILRRVVTPPEVSLRPTTAAAG